MAQAGAAGSADTTAHMASQTEEEVAPVPASAADLAAIMQAIARLP